MICKPHDSWFSNLYKYNSPFALRRNLFLNVYWNSITENSRFEWWVTEILPTNFEHQIANEKSCKRVCETHVQGRSKRWRHFDPRLNAFRLLKIQVEDYWTLSSNVTNGDGTSGTDFGELKMWKEIIQRT